MSEQNCQVQKGDWVRVRDNVQRGHLTYGDYELSHGEIGRVVDTYDANSATHIMFGDENVVLVNFPLRTLSYCNIVVKYIEPVPPSMVRIWTGS